MWSDWRAFERDICRVKWACANTFSNRGSREFVYDRKGKKVFLLSSLMRVRDFGIVPGRVPSVLCSVYVFLKLIQRKFIFVDLSFLPRCIDLIDLGPLLGTRGTQVKVYDFDNLQVFCGCIGDRISKIYGMNEAEVYEHYSDCINVPRLINKIDDSCYVRELIVGAQANQTGCSSLKLVIEDLMTFYHGSPYVDVPKNNYISKAAQKLRDAELLDQKLISWLVEISLQSHFDDLRLVKAHGDFAEKNILESNGSFFIIDWERVSYKSLTYDVCNFFFKKPRSSSNGGENHPFCSLCLLELQNQILMNMCGRIESTVEPSYALFLLERASFEIDLYDKNPERLHNFADIFAVHVEDFYDAHAAIKK